MIRAQVMIGERLTEYERSQIRRIRRNCKSFIAFASELGVFSHAKRARTGSVYVEVSSRRIARTTNGRKRATFRFSDHAPGGMVPDYSVHLHRWCLEGDQLSGTARGARAHLLGLLGLTERHVRRLRRMRRAREGA